MKSLKDRVKISYGTAGNSKTVLVEEAGDQMVAQLSAKKWKKYSNT